MQRPSEINQNRPVSILAASLGMTSNLTPPPPTHTHTLPNFYILLNIIPSIPSRPFPPIPKDYLTRSNIYSTLHWCLICNSAVWFPITGCNFGWLRKAIKGGGIHNLWIDGVTNAIVQSVTSHAVSALSKPKFWFPNLVVLFQTKEKRWKDQTLEQCRGGSRNSG